MGFEQRKHALFLLLQGYHSQRCAPHILLSSSDHNEGGHFDPQLSISVLATVYDECPQRPAMGCLRTGELVCCNLSYT